METRAYTCLPGLLFLSHTLYYSDVLECQLAHKMVDLLLTISSSK